MYKSYSIPQGWRCPVCERCYSPTTPMCFYCGNKEATVQSTGTSINNNPSITTATTNIESNVKITAWNGLTTCERDCKSCSKYEKNCFNGIETISDREIISHRKPPETTYYDYDSLDSFIKHFQD